MNLWKSQKHPLTAPNNTVFLFNKAAIMCSGIAEEYWHYCVKLILYVVCIYFLLCRDIAVFFKNISIKNPIIQDCSPK